MEVGVSQLDLGPIPGFPLVNTRQFYIQIIFYHKYGATPVLVVHWEYMELNTREILLWSHIILVHLNYFYLW